MIFLLFFSLFPQYASEIIFNVPEYNFEIKVISDGEKFRIDLNGKKKETYYKEKEDLLILQDGKWKEIKKPLYNQNNFFLSIFFGKEENFQIEVEEDNEGLKSGAVSHKDWGQVTLKRISVNKLAEIPDHTFPKKSKNPLNLSKLKSLLKSEDEKEVSGTAGARGVGEEENMDAEPNYGSLLEVEKMKVTKEEAEKFAKEGGLK